MITQNQNILLDKKERDELVDFGIRIGQACWDVFRQSKFGFPRVFMLPSDDSRRRANELFHLGFCARLFACPPTDLETSDADTERIECEMMWQDYLGTMAGKIVFGYGVYPDTPEFILGYAREFFLAGFQAGTIAVREIFRS